MAGMEFGLHALGIGPGADPAVIAAVGRSAEARGFASLWCGEHVVMVDRPQSVYPYAADGCIAVAADADWLDPLAVLAYLAAVTSTIGLATGVLLLPEHNPVVAAKHAASVDTLSGGRLTLGVGIGWSADEFAALGLEFSGRGARTIEYIDALRALWGTDPSSYAGAYVHFDGVRCFPKPVHGKIPVVLGGNGDRALDRVAAYGDGWYGFNVTPDALADRLAFLRARCKARGRSTDDLFVAVALTGATPADLPAVAALGVTQVVLVESPPDDAAAVAGWVNGLAEHWRLAGGAAIP
jgi:probable F420-dependent oxidoreductase